MLRSQDVLIITCHYIYIQLSKQVVHARFCMEMHHDVIFFVYIHERNHWVYSNIIFEHKAHRIICNKIYWHLKPSTHHFTFANKSWLDVCILHKQIQCSKHFMGLLIYKPKNLNYKKWITFFYAKKLKFLDILAPVKSDKNFS